MALVMPVLVGLMTGVIDWGWVMFHRHLGADAAAVGVRAGASADGDDDPVAVAEAAAKQRWSDLGLGAIPEIEARTGSGRIEVEVRFGDLRPVGLVPGPTQTAMVQSRRLEATTDAEER